MPFYEYRCEVCERHFELRRPVHEASAPASCPEGHPGARRLLSVFATAGRSGGPAPMPVGGGGGGCCGGACGCGAR